MKGAKAYTLPDVTIWSAPGEHHEIKHKNPTRWNAFGLEVYRWEALLWFWNECKQSVWYTIHRWDLSPDGRDGRLNRMEDWWTCSVPKLERAMRRKQHRILPGYSWIAGEEQRTKICYWPVSLWTPLEKVWESIKVSEVHDG